MRFALLLGLTFLVSPFLYAEEPGYTCSKEQVHGRAFTCNAINLTEAYHVPMWVLHTKPGAYRTWGEHFHQMSPKEWTMLEMRLYPVDQSEAPYDKITYRSYRSWVRTCPVGRGDKAVFSAYVEGIEPPPCRSLEKPKKN